ncbi:MAG: type II secretion system protein [Candidatus Nealsonbacteria bacterium]|nr:type II secretion system protein [Candidatus Nealsonbacteria bacterium]
MKSFTLIEILVVISLISILTIFVVPNFHLANSRIAVERAAYKLARDIRNAEEMSVSSRKTSFSKFNSTLFPSGGYGLSFTGSVNSYILFADCNNDGKYDETSGAPSCAVAGPGSTYPEKIEEIFLEPGIVIKKPSSHILDSITFFPPDPLIVMKPNPNSNPGIELTSTIDSSKSVVVSVNEAGLIEIKH